jgi:hypothetical protein
LIKRNLGRNLPAILYRSRDSYAASNAAVEPDEIGSGPLFKMVRIALSDPDLEIWRYSISVDGQLIVGQEIARIASNLND